MKLTKDQLSKLKGEYEDLGFRESWKKEEDELLVQLIENGIISPKFVQEKFFPKRTDKAVGKRLGDLRREMNAKNKS